MIVFYADIITQETIQLIGDEHRHCVKTLRKKVGDLIHVFGHIDYFLKCEIETIDKDHVIARIVEREELPEINHLISVAIAPTKNADRLEWFVSKSVEIGVQQILIMNTDHTERSRYKLKRLQRILISAAKQSLNFRLPDLRDQLSFQQVLNIHREFSDKLIAHCNDPDMNINALELNPKAKIGLLIGPEGDFSKAEIDQAKSMGYQEISLGSSRLRTETAGIVGVTLLNAKLY